MKLASSLVLSLTLTLAIVGVLGRSEGAVAAGTFLETFSGWPGGPLPWRPTTWDVTVHSRDTATWSSLQTMHAGHGADCAAPPATHDISRYEDAVFQCRDHLMTAIYAGGYGLIYLTPNQLVDFSTGEAVVRFDMSTLNTSSRDWPDLWITPFNENLQLTLDNWLPDGNGEPRNALHIKLENETASARVVRNFAVQNLAANWWTRYATFLTPSATRRDTFELRLSRTHVRFGMPAYNFWWVDTDIAPLEWTSGVLQLGHHSYNPTKDCAPSSICAPNTWHWDNVSISPALPFTMLRADRRYVDASTSPQLNFGLPAPSGAHLRFTGIGSNLAVSYDGGASWQTPQRQLFSKIIGVETFRSYWTPVPAGTSSVRFRGSAWCCGPWLVRDVSIWASDAPAVVPPALPAPTPFVPAPTAVVVPAPPSPAPPPAARPPNAAAFHSAWVDQTAYPTLAPGETGSVTLRFRNTGAETWQTGVAGRHVNLGVVGDSGVFEDLGMAVGWLSANRPATMAEPVVPPGGIGTFTFAVRAPAQPGLYQIPLRLVADGVTWLDDQGVFVSVRSDHGFHSAWAAQTPWPVLRPGEVSTVTIVFRNTGRRSWIRGASLEQANLGVVGDARSLASLGVDWPSADRVAIQSEPVVGPGGLARFIFGLRGPTEPGRYFLDLRPVIDGMSWLEDDGVYVEIMVMP